MKRRPPPRDAEAVPASRQRHRRAGRAPAAPALRGPAGRGCRRRPDLPAGRHRRRAVGSRATRAWRLSQSRRRVGQAPRPRSGPAANGCRWPARSCSTPTRFNQEFDAIHDRAVVHASFRARRRVGYAEREGGVDGRRLITVAAGWTSPSTWRWHSARRCASSGQAMRRAGRHRHPVQLRAWAWTGRHARRLGLAYSHLSGTMQAHIEGSPAVGRQVGLNARAAVTARAGARRFSRPRDILEAVRLFRALRRRPGALGRSRRRRRPRLPDRAHEPQALPHRTRHAQRHRRRAAPMREHALRPGDIAGMKVYASSLIVRLVGRPAGPAWTRPPPTVHGLHRRHGHPAWPGGHPGFRSGRTGRSAPAGAGRPHRGAGRRQSRSQRHVLPQRVELHLRDGCLALDMPEFPAAGAAAGRSRARRRSAPAAPRPNSPVPPDRAEALIRRSDEPSCARSSRCCRPPTSVLSRVDACA